MTYSPGDLLVRDGAVPREAMRKALAVRAIEGGSIGETLVRLGFIDEDRLAQFYHKRLILPLVAEARLGSIAPSVLDLVPAEVAAEFRVIPLSIDGDGSLLVAMADPSDNHAVDEIGFFVDRFILRGVATESAIRRALARHYKVSLAPSPTNERVTRPDLPAPLPEPRPAFVATRVDAPLPSVRREPEPLLLTKKKRDDDTPLPPPSPSMPTNNDLVVPPELLAPREPEPLLLTKKRERQHTQTKPGFQVVTPILPPLVEMREAPDRDRVAAILLEYASKVLGRAALFVVRRGALVGLDARGGGLDRASVEMLQLPLTTPSLLRDVAQSRLPFRGPMPDSPQNRAFARALGVSESAEVALFPIEVRFRVVAVLFGDRITHALPEAELQAIIHETGLAYERILEQRAGR